MKNKWNKLKNVKTLFCFLYKSSRATLSIKGLQRYNIRKKVFNGVSEVPAEMY